MCEVAMELHNPLPFELKVLNMVSTFSVRNVMFCKSLYFGAFLPTVLFLSRTVSLFSLFMDEEDLTYRLFLKQPQRLCHRKLCVMSRHFLNNHKCWQKCVPTERWCLETAGLKAT